MLSNTFEPTPDRHQVWDTWVVLQVLQSSSCCAVRLVREYFRANATFRRTRQPIFWSIPVR